MLRIKETARAIIIALCLWMGTVGMAQAQAQTNPTGPNQISRTDEDARSTASGFNAGWLGLLGLVGLFGLFARGRDDRSYKPGDATSSR